MVIWVKKFNPLKTILRPSRTKEAGVFDLAPDLFDTFAELCVVCDCEHLSYIGDEINFKQRHFDSNGQ